MALSPQQLKELQEQAKVYRDVNQPVLPDKLKHALQLLSEKKRALLNLPYPIYPGDMRMNRPPESQLAEGLRERKVRADLARLVVVPFFDEAIVSQRNVGGVEDHSTRSRFDAAVSQGA